MSVIRTGREYGAWPVLAESDGQLVVLSCSDQASRWDPLSGTELWQVDFWAGGGRCAIARLNGGGRILAVASEDGVERLDALSGAALPSPLMEGVGTVWDVAAGVLPGGRSFFAGAGHDFTVHRWDAVTGRPLGEPLAGHERSVMSIAVVPADGDGDAVIVSGDEAGVILCWDAATGRQIGKGITGPSEAIHQIEPLSVSGGSALLLCVDHDRLLWRWDAATGEPVGEPVRLASESEYPTLTTAVLDDVARMFVSGTGDGMVWEWDPVAAERVEVAMPGISCDVLVRSDGRGVFAAGSREGDITLYA